MNSSLFGWDEHQRNRWLESFGSGEQDGIGDRNRKVDTVRVRATEAVLEWIAWDALERPSACEAWKVGDVIAHLIWFAETYGGMAERGLRGDLSAPEGFSAPGTLSGPDVEELYAKASITLRRELGDALLLTFDQRYDWLKDTIGSKIRLAQRYDWLNEVMGGIGPEDWGKPCYHTNGIHPVEWLPGVVIQELAIHEWDIRSTVEQSPLVSEASLPGLIERASSRRRPWTIPFPAGGTSSGPIRYCSELTGAAAGRRDIVVEGDQPRMETPAEGSANLYLSGDASTFVLMMFDRLSLDSAIATGRFSAKGDLELVTPFDQWIEAMD